ncbi:MAG: DUF2339 domain-containing protein [Lachnospiraceae bacterium]|nr:DUF2339 domain-containing protein [Lachnospiraceae bacterium]
MSERLNKLLFFEKRLLADRKEMVQWLEETRMSEESDSKLVEYKLDCFQKELIYLSKQTALLKEELLAQEKNAEVPVEPVVVAEAIAPQEEKPVQPEAEPPKAETSQSFVMADAEAMQEKQQQEQPKQESKWASFANSAGWEKTIGKSLMGIFASVLIFISLILFATLLLPYFNDTAKMITTYVVSFAFLGLGLWKMKKDPQNKFYIALTGCGMGALYISLLLSNMYFKVLGDIPLYVLIAIWGIGVVLFSKERSKIFQVIGELGITIAMLFGCALCIDEGDVVKFIVLIVFYIISFGVFYVVHYQQEFADNLMQHVFNVINLSFVGIACMGFPGEPLARVEVWMLFILVLASLASCFWHKTERESFSFYIFSMIYSIMAYVILGCLCSERWIFGIIAYITSILFMFLFQCKKTYEEEGKYVAQWLLYIVAIIGVCCWENGFAYGAVPLLILPALVAGFWTSNTLFRYTGLLVGAGYLLFVSDINVYIHYLLCLTVVVAAHVLLYWRKDCYQLGYKICVYVLTMLTLLQCAPVLYEIFDRDDNVGIILYVFLMAYNLFAMKSSFSMDFKTDEQESPGFYNFVNMILMIVGLSAIAEGGSSSLRHIVWIIVTLITFLVNSKNYLDKRENMAAGVYVGVKFVVFMNVVLNSFEAVNYVISISCLLFAILSIIIGFIGDYKALRIFGLVLSMISIFKLIMVDISYQNTLGNALSFFGSGILCFVISLIYNYIDKKVKERA